MHTFEIAGALLVVVGAVHSVLGEVMIFRKLRGGGLVPATGAGPLSGGNVRILWASWHALSVFGWGIGAILIRLADTPPGSSIQSFLVSAIVYSLVGSALLVLVGTNGRHPGWIALLAAAVLTWVG